MIKLSLVFQQELVYLFDIYLLLALSEQSLNLRNPIHVDSFSVVALRRVHPVFAVQELNYVSIRISDSEIILDFEVL